jgi:hypothetical protein
MKNPKSYILLTFFIWIAAGSMSFLILLPGCSGGGGGTEKWDFFDRATEILLAYQSNPATEYWEISAPLVGDDEGDYSFLARFMVTTANNEILGFGNANGYPLGTFFLTGKRTGDNVEFEIISQNRYRGLSLTGKGIYVNDNSRIGGNKLEGKDYVTTFEDPIIYTGNFAVNVYPMSSPKVNGTYTGRLEGSYNSIENGDITLDVNLGADKITISKLKGSLIGKTQAEGSFDYDNPGDFGEISINANKFNFAGSVEGDTVQIQGSIVNDVASGFVLIQKDTKTYLGAFSALLE